MGPRVRLAGVVLSVVFALAGAGPAAAAAPEGARLDGAPIRLSEVAAYHCHDLLHPTITCFRTQAAADLDMARIGGSRSVDALSYVRLHDDAGYEGGSIALSQDYGNLGSIGWNDRTSSFRVLNGGSGLFWEDAGPGGSYYSFCCSGAVSNLGSWNDRISAVEGDA